VLVSRYAWHTRNYGHPKLLGVKDWRGRGIGFTDGLCRRCAERIHPAVRPLVIREVGLFELHYKKVSRAQSLYEARMKHALEKSASLVDAAATLPKNEPWETIRALPAIEDLMAPLDDCVPRNPSPRSAYCRSFLRPLDSASAQLRKALLVEFA
jgi:hypothetical protein